MRPNETPDSIYGSFIENFTQFNAKPGVFSSPDFAPFFFVQLNDQFLLAASIDINNGGVSVGEAQVNWFVNDWLTVVVGRYLTPIGFFNERLNHEWINRLPDVPLMFRQVSPLTRRWSCTTIASGVAARIMRAATAASRAITVLASGPGPSTRTRISAVACRSSTLRAMPESPIPEMRDGMPGDDRHRDAGLPLSR